MVSRSRILHFATWRRNRPLIGVALLLVLVACEDAPLPEEDVVRPVRYTRVALQGVSEARTYSGSAHAELETDLSFRVGGTLVRRAVNVGSQVAQGDVVAALDKTDFQVQLDEALAGLARAEAERRNAIASYDRTQELYENQTASRTQLDSARSLAESAQAQYRATSQQVEAARLQLSYATLTSPQQCTVAQTFVEINQNVSPGQPIVRLNCGDCAEVMVSVPETDIAKIEEGMRVAVVVTALPDAAIEGVVKEVGVATDGGGTTYAVTVSLQDQCTAVRSGMTVNVRFSFPTGGAEGGLVVPYVAVGEDRNGRFVFVLVPDDDGRLFAERRPVSVGNATPEGIVIFDGLTTGELIATAGVRRLSEGQEVKLLGQSEAGP